MTQNVFENGDADHSSNPLTIPTDLTTKATTPKDRNSQLADTMDNFQAQNARTEAPDPFDLKALRLSQDFASSIGVKKVLATVPCRKPRPQEFVRVRQGVDWRFETAVLEDKENREIYLVHRDLWNELASEIHPVCLFLAINRQGDVFVWAVKLPAVDGRSNAWNESAVAAAQLAESKWVRMTANMKAGMYDLFEAAAELQEPEWPELSLSEILKLCFRDRYIESTDHSVIRALRGLE